MEACSDELSVVDVAVLVGVHHVHGILDVLLSQQAPSDQLHSFFQLING